MNTCVLLLGVIESAGKPALRIGFTIPLLSYWAPASSFTAGAINCLVAIPKS